MKYFSKFKIKYFFFVFILLFLFSIFLMLVPSCSPAQECQNSISTDTSDPNGHQCSTKCDCNNQNYEGECLQGTCVAYPRDLCLGNNAVQCVQKFPKQRGCQIGIHLCRDLGLHVDRYGDCLCPKSKEIILEKNLEIIETDGGNDESKTFTFREGMECHPGEQKPCYTGPKGTLDIGICRSGIRSCHNGYWSQKCLGERLPTQEICHNGLDDDCDGQTDESYPIDICGNNIDDNCDGQIDENCNGCSASKIQTLRYVRMGYSSYNKDITFSPDGKFIAISGNQIIELYHLEKKRFLRKFTGHKSYVYSVAFSPDGKTLASGSSDKMIKLWDLTTGKEKTSLFGHITGISQVSFSPNGEIFASLSSRTIKLWNAKTYQYIRTLFSPPDQNFYSFAFSPNGQILASISTKDIQLWDIATGKIKTSWQESSLYRSRILFTRDGKNLLYIKGKSIKLWNISKKTVIRIYNEPHNRIVYSITLSPDGKSFASIGSDRMIKIWNLSKATPIKTLSDKNATPYRIAFHPKGKLLASISDSYSRPPKIWDLSTGKFTTIIISKIERILKLTFSLDGEKLALSYYIIDRPNYKRLFGIQILDTKTNLILRTISKISNEPQKIALSPHGKWLAFADTNKKIQIFDTITGQLKHSLSGHSGSISFLLFPPNEKTLLSASEDGSIKLWDILTGRLIWTLVAHSGLISNLAMSFDGKILISASYDRTIQIRKFPIGTLFRTIRTPSRIIKSISLSFDGQFLLVIFQDNTMKFWNLRSQKLIQLPPRKSHYPYIFTLSPDGKILSFTQSYHQISLEKILNPILLTSFSTTSDLTNLIFNPRNNMLAAGTASGDLFIWGCPSP